MRWKLLLLASLVAALLGFGLWGAITIAFFGTAVDLVHHAGAFFASLLLPLGLAVFAGVFVYRHTARRRKTQAVISATLTVFLITGIYLVAMRISPARFRVSRSNNYDVAS